MTVKEKVERMREFTETTESSEITNDALTAILGDSHRGRVRGYGFGVTVTKLKFQNGASRKYEKTIDEMQQKLQRQEQRQEEMLKQMHILLTTSLFPMLHLKSHLQQIWPGRGNLEQTILVQWTGGPFISCFWEKCNGWI
ncbi:uncharacterized protein LOC132283872 isoform X3 [Cornus florida]|uniref:uncharacterized protein LOC132283872 isoform X3 n=1 Tax=Cornus florida TaxID=4283 RepID=UPI00289CBEC7|nr:uncharacterized protein LOC132283872 isoform X3 [Cornus florida]